MELEERPSFFKVLVGDFSQQLRMPRAFLKNFNGRVPRMCGLRAPCGNLWAVNLKEIKDRVVFHNGWQSFAKHHFLEVGDFLTFTKDDGSIFDVIIYDKSYCEKNVEAAKSRIGNVVDRTINNHVILGKRPALDLVEETSIGSISFNPENPFFTSIFTRYTRYDLRIPTKVVIAAGLMNNKTIMLQDPTGRPWSIKLNETTRGRMRMEGWCNVCKENQISFGDTLVIEVVKHSVLQLHVYKVGAALDVETQS
ncbi:putative B3 domain-containing protein [Rosa sericea]